MIVSEWFGWECILFVAGGLCTRGEESCAVVEAMPLCTTVMVCEFILTFGLGTATSNRIGNLLGEGRGDAAKFCAQVLRPSDVTHAAVAPPQSMAEMRMGGRLLACTFFTDQLA